MGEIDGSKKKNVGEIVHKDLAQYRYEGNGLIGGGLVKPLVLYN
jgi:hypothetical protein